MNGMYKNNEHVLMAGAVLTILPILVVYLIEVFGWFGVEKAGFEWRKAIGAAVAIAGIVIFRWE